MFLLMLLMALAAMLLALWSFDRLWPAASCALTLRMARRNAGLTEAEEWVEGQRVPYLLGGQGEPLLLVHGFGGDKDNFTPVAGLLSRHYRVLIPDLPGFGEAGRDPNANYHIADQVRHLVAFMDQLGLARVHLGGSSMGGFIATELAARHPERVASLWLLSAAGTAAANESAVVQQAMASGEFPLLMRELSDCDRLLALTMTRPPFIPYGVKHSLARRSVADYVLHRRIIEQFGKESPLLEQQFQRIEAPALIVWGEGDQVLSPQGAQALQALLPNSELQLMPGIGHLPMIEAPRTTAARYLRFRAGLRQA